MDQDTQAVTDLALVLLSEAGKGGGNSDELLSSVEPTFDRLKIHLSRRLGKGGYVALLKRAFTLASGDYPWLECLTISDDGTLCGMDLAPGSLSVSQAAAGGIAILARLIGLLDTFIGRDLCLRVLQSGWPGLTNFYTDSAASDFTEENEMAEINEQLVITVANQHTLAGSVAAVEGRMLSVINGLNAMICEIDVVTGEFAFLSETSNSFLGYSIEQWASDGFWQQIIEADDYEATQAGFAMAGVTGDAYQHAFRVVAENGSVVWLRNIMKAVRNADGHVVKRRCIIVDVTEQQFAHLAMVKDLDRNRNIADALQFSLVWQNFEKSFYDLDVAVSYEPALDEALVGGDFFDAFILPNKSVLLFVGDVTGKGLKAASRTAEIIYALRAFAQNYKNATDMITQLNEFICDYHTVENRKPNMFVALSLVVIDPVTGNAQVTSAGAEPTLILRASGELVEVSAGGLTLGVDHNSTYETSHVVLNDDDLLIMTTDGIIEARKGSSFFGLAGLLNAARETNATAKLADIGSAVLEAARAYGGGGFRDDACLLLARLDRIV